LARETAHWGITDSVEPDVLETPIHRSLSEIARRTVLPLPPRVRDMIADRRTEPPDERVAGAALFNVGGD
jgi:hypothetical protein